MALRVFLVEDSAAMREHLTELLMTEADVDLVGVAETEAQAKDWLASNTEQWDIALVDLFLREGTGAGVVQHCRDRRPQQTLLVMSNYALLPLLHHCKLLGADAVFDKATELDDLVAYCIGLAAQGPNRVVWH